MKISSVDMEDWEIYEESFNKPKEKRHALATKNVEVQRNFNHICRFYENLFGAG